MERQLEIKFQKLMIDHQQNQVKTPVIEPESKVEKNLEKFLQANTAKFDSVLNLLQVQTDKNLKAWQSKCDVTTKLQQDFKEYSSEIELLKNNRKQDTKLLDSLNDNLKAFGVAIAGFQTGLDSTAVSLLESKTVQGLYQQNVIYHRGEFMKDIGDLKTAIETIRSKEIKQLGDRVAQITTDLD